MSTKINKANYDKNKQNLSKTAINIYEVFQEIIPAIKKDYEVSVNENHIQYSTKNGSLNDEHNGRILYEARNAFNQFKKFGIINDFIEEVLSEDYEHIVRFTII